MRSEARSNLGQTVGPEFDPVVIRKGPRRAGTDEAESKHDADKFVARWLDVALTAWGKATAYAEAIEVDLAHVSRMRTGEKPTPLRALLPFLGHAEPVLAFCAPLLASIGYVARPVRGMTRAQLAEALLADLEAEPMGRKLIEQTAEKRGQGHEQTAMALRNEETDK